MHLHSSYVYPSRLEHALRLGKEGVDVQHPSLSKKPHVMLSRFGRCQFRFLSCLLDCKDEWMDVRWLLAFILAYRCKTTCIEISCMGVDLHLDSAESTQWNSIGDRVHPGSSHRRSKFSLAFFKRLPEMKEYAAGQSAVQYYFKPWERN